MRALPYLVVFIAGATVAFLGTWNTQVILEHQSLLVGTLVMLIVACNAGPSIWAARREKPWAFVAVICVGQGLGAYARMGWSTGVWTW